MVHLLKMEMIAVMEIMQVAQVEIRGVEALRQVETGVMVDQKELRPISGLLGILTGARVTMDRQAVMDKDQTLG